MKSTKKAQSNYEFFIQSDTSPYKGEWIAIADKKIVSHGIDAQVVYKEAKQKLPSAQVSLAKVPDKQVLILSFSS